MKAFVINLLKNNLSPFYYYHNHEHTLYVVEKALEIGQYEKCTAKEIDLLNTAALFHDTGYLNSYAGHEEESCLLARQYLPGYGYLAPDTDAICAMIMATKMPQSPKNKLEEIIADADLEYLGTDSAGIKSDSLFFELQSLNPLLTKEQWNRTQISFLQKHHYFTRFCKENREPAKRIYLEKLMQDNQ
ncbi:MAG: HD domain-containing protein [Ferruginibacter sp.]|nr:HD domain-containing protein [Ferruginibacter sp.]